MRGLRAVLYVAVLLCVAQFASADCGANGNHIDDLGQCICLSGYSGVNCEVAASQTCNLTMSVASATQADHFPTLDVAAAAFTQNTLRISLLSDYVQGRRYNSINWVAQNLTQCSLGFQNSFWSTNFTDGCKDQFHLDMPWIFHADCGFGVNVHVENDTFDSANEDNQTLIAANHYISFAARFTLNYTDALGSIENFTLTRTTAVPYRVYVQFPTRLDVSLTDVQIHSEVEMGFALTGDNFDPETRALTIEMTIINIWPNMLGYDSTQWGVITPDLSHIFPNNQFGPKGDGLGVAYDQVPGAATGDCPNDPINKPLCKQVFQFQFTTDLCNYNGYYNFTAPMYTCRDSSYVTCTSLPWDLYFDMETSSICSAINTTLSLSGHLNPFYNKIDDTSFSGDASTKGFTIGSYGYFQVELENMQGNTVSLDFYEISFQANGFTNRNFLMKNGAALSNDTYLPVGGPQDSADAFHYDEAKLVVNNENKWFSVYFSSVVFKVLPSSVTTYTFRASAYATYLGNEGETKKRTVEFVWDAPAVDDQSVSTFAKVGLRQAGTLVNGDNLKASDKEVTSNNLAYIIGGGGAGLVLIVLAVIGLAIHHKKRQVAKALAEATRA